MVRLGGGTVELVCRPIEKFVGEKSPNSVKAKYYNVSMTVIVQTGKPLKYQVIAESYNYMLIPSQCLKTVCREYTGTTLNGKD